MVGAWLMMAEATTVARPSGWDFPLLWATLPMVGALLLAAAIIAGAKKWRQRAAGPERLTANAQLAHFRSLYERGELSVEEFTRIRALLGERLKKEVALRSLPPAPPAVPKGDPGDAGEWTAPSERSDATSSGQSGGTENGTQGHDLPTPPSDYNP